MTQPGGFNFEEIRKMMEQMGILGADGDVDFEAIMQRMQQMQSSGGAMMFGIPAADQNPDAAWLTTITAAKHALQEAGPDPDLQPREQDVVVDAERLAQSWLDEFTTFESPGLPARLSTRAQWLDDTSAGWRSIVEPIIEGLADALQRSSSEGAAQMEGLDLSSMMGPLLRQSASAMYRERLRRVLAKVARDTLTGTEIGFNLAAKNDVVVIPANVSEFTQDLDADESDMMLLLLLREAARQRLFANVGWLSPQLQALMTHYAREITIDLDAISDRFSPEHLEQMSLEDLTKIGEEVQVSFFRPASTETQLQILERLGTLLALVEGWVDHVAQHTLDKWMPHAPELVEVLRRRRAAESPVRSVLRELIGLELTPRLVRDANNLWGALEHDRGVEGRDAIWSHPDLIPTAKDLTDPMAFVAKGKEPPASDDLDDELRKLLES
ncbi:zinc-dependent metalloprotease [uncultured Tessaracoccus sp.]|uniref:zinc-dependent metalloprotease n=1 Tax=uncultured Tessaracoccus sp. TaxID=905023 RepID=UPI002629F2FB|nr:zinc-dependent metalloprotease [uncultured Tessaracoccus sp.]